MFNFDMNIFHYLHQEEKRKLQSFIDKMKNDELSLEDILEEDMIIQDLSREENNSEFSSFFTNESIRKLIDYATKMPKSDEKDIGYKYPFKATELLCCGNKAIMDIFMNKIAMVDDSEEEEEEEGEEKDEINNQNREKENKMEGIYNEEGIFEEKEEETHKMNEESKKEENNYHPEKKVSNKEEEKSPKDILNKSKKENKTNQEEQEKKITETEKKKDNEEKNNKPVIIIYDNVDYFLGFLKESEEIRTNHVLVGYFCQIFNHLIKTKSTEIIQYIFNYPKRDKFDILQLLVKNTKRKSMGKIINKLLIFQGDDAYNLFPKKCELLEKLFIELKETKDEEKYECICSTLKTSFYEKEFFLEFIKETKFLSTLYSLLTLFQSDSKKLITFLPLFINLHENILNIIDNKCTEPYEEEIPYDFLKSYYSGNLFNLEEENQNVANPLNKEITDKMILTLIDLIEKCEFNFMNDFGDFESEGNNKFMTVYLKEQKKLGMKKILQIKLFRNLLDLLVNSWARFDSQEIKDLIKNIIKHAQKKKIFWKMHKIFLDFPFCNLYQIYYQQIMNIILNEKSPEELIKNVLLKQEGNEEKNIIQILMDKILKDMEFEYVSGNKAFHANFSFEISILIKINESKNKFVTELKKYNKNLIIFHNILGQDINSLFNQKLLYNNIKDFEPLKYFCQKNIMEVLNEDKDIFYVYSQEGDYEKLLSEKKEREKQEQEERKKLYEEREKIINNLNKDEKEELEIEKPYASIDEIETMSEESEEDKSFNDVNYWKVEIKPDEKIINNIFNDLD